MGRSTLAETNRHNVITEGLSLGTLAETSRSNLAREAETNRSNRANESLKRQSNVITQGYNEGSLAEILRHNQAEEQLRRQQYNLDLRKQGEQEILNTANVEKTKADTTRTKVETEFLDDYLRMQGLKTATGSLKDFVGAVRGIIGGLGGIEP